MSFPASVYALFNIIEGFLWIGVAVYLIRNRRNLKQDKLFWVYLAAPCFILFSISDFLEAPRYGVKLPNWLWALKLSSGFVIFLSRVVYLGTQRKSDSIKTVLLGLGLLAVALFYILAL